MQVFIRRGPAEAQIYTDNTIKPLGKIEKMCFSGGLVKSIQRNWKGVFMIHFGKQQKRREQGFTLIELLVVIAIIALLLSIVVPSLRAAKKHAQNVVCQSNLRQWGLSYMLYTEEGNGYFAPWGGYQVSFMETLRPYYNDIDEMRLCPSAKEVSTANPTSLQPNSFFGYTFNAWQVDPSADWLPDDDSGLGSYGENSWIRSGQPPAYGNINDTWKKMTSIQSRSQTPLLADARWNNAWPNHTHPLPSPAAREEDFYNLSNWHQIECFVMRRHKKGLNVLVADGSVNNWEAEMLWNLNWHRSYQKRGDVNLDWMNSW